MPLRRRDSLEEGQRNGRRLRRECFPFISSLAWQRLPCGTSPQPFAFHGRRCPWKGGEEVEGEGDGRWREREVEKNCQCLQRFGDRLGSAKMPIVVRVDWKSSKAACNEVLTCKDFESTHASTDQVESSQQSMLSNSAFPRQDSSIIQ